MSQIIFLTPPAYGHVNPVLPVMQELANRGEQVVAYNTQEFRPQIERTGAEFRGYPATEISSSEISKVLQDGNLASATGLILRSTEQILPFLLDEFGREKPDLVVFDSIAVWGKMAANQLRLRAAASIGHLVMDEKHMKPGDVLQMIGQYLPKVPGILRTRRRLIQHYGNAYPDARPLFPMRDQLNIVFTTRDLQPDTPLIDKTFHFVGPSINPQTRSEDFPFADLGADPVIYISLGTVHSTEPVFFRTCLEAFADVRARFIMSIGRQVSLDSLGPVPGNFIVRPSVPQLDVLQRANVFMTHAGINSVHEGLYYGVPLILIPHQFEQLLNARCVAARGAGLIVESRMHRKPITVSDLRRALEQILSTPRYREAAREMQKSLRASGGYRQAADQIQAYIAGP